MDLKKISEIIGNVEFSLVKHHIDFTRYRAVTRRPFKEITEV